MTAITSFNNNQSVTAGQTGVEIVGSGFGATEGRAELLSSTNRFVLSINSWTDTLINCDVPATIPDGTQFELAVTPFGENYPMVFGSNKADTVQDLRGTQPVIDNQVIQLLGSLGGAFYSVLDGSGYVDDGVDVIVTAGGSVWLRKSSDNLISDSDFRDVKNKVRDVNKQVLISARNGVMVTKSANNSQSIRRKYKNGAAMLKNLSVALPNWYMGLSSELLPDNDFIRVRMSIEYPIGTTPVHFTRNGSDSIDIPVGRTVTAKELTGVIIPPDAQFYIHTFVEPYKLAVNSGEIPTGRYYVHYSSNRDNYVLNSGVDLTDQIGGQPSATAAPANLYSHVALSGEPVYSVSYRSLAIIGDSIAYGFNEHNQMTGDATGATGIYERWASANRVGSLNISTPSFSAADALQIISGAYPNCEVILSEFANCAVLALGRNDFGSGRTSTELESDIDNISSHLTNNFGILSVPITVSPASSSTDSWATVANQTAIGNNSERILYNNKIRNRESFLEISAFLESDTDSGVWNAPSFTTDGIHTSSTSADSTASQLTDIAEIFGGF